MSCTITMLSADPVPDAVSLPVSSVYAPAGIGGNNNHNVPAQPQSWAEYSATSGKNRWSGAPGRMWKKAPGGLVGLLSVLVVLTTLLSPFMQERLNGDVYKRQPRHSFLCRDPPKQGICRYTLYCMLQEKNQVFPLA